MVDCGDLYTARPWLRLAVCGSLRVTDDGVKDDASEAVVELDGPVCL